MKQSESTTAKESKKIDTLPTELRKLYEDVIQHNDGLYKKLANM